MICINCQHRQNIQNIWNWAIYGTMTVPLTRRFVMVNMFHSNSILISALRGISEFATLFSQEFGDDVFLFTSFLSQSHGWAYWICYVTQFFKDLQKVANVYIQQYRHDFEGYPLFSTQSENDMMITAAQSTMCQNCLR